MNRRDLLCAVGAGYAALGTASGAERSPEGRDPPSPTAADRTAADDDLRTGGATDPTTADGAVSLRTVGERMDPLEGHHPTRLWGNGPPFDRAANEPSAAKKVTYSVFGGGIRARHQYVTRAGVADRHGYDLGMMNRDVVDGGRESGIAGTPYSEKGLVETHRWVDPAGGEWTTRRQANVPPGESIDPTPRYRSMRSVADRHREGVWHRCLWLNTKLDPELAKVHRKKRAKAYGELLRGYDVLALGELYKQKHMKLIEEHYDRGPREGELTVGRTTAIGDDLCSIVGNRRDGPKPRRVDDAETASAPYLIEGAPVPAYVEPTRKKGWQRLSVGVDLPGVPEAHFEVYLTHLKAFNSNRARKKRRTEIQLLADEIRERQRERPAWPKILVGDLNVHSEKSHHGWNDYDFLLSELDEAGMQDAWVTHGGLAGSTIGTDGCTPRQGSGRVCRCDDFAPGDLGGNRLDYVFVEKPRSEHEVALDVARMWRVSTKDACRSVRRRVDDDLFVVDGEALTDHFGVGFGLLTSPA